MLTDAALLTIVKAHLPPSLYRHSVKVAELAKALAQKHGADPGSAYRAGLLHDWAKGWPRKKLLQFVRKNNVKVPNLLFVLKEDPGMSHAYAGSAAVKQLKLTKDSAALRAIAHHTFGRMGMAVLDKILFVADAASLDRTHAAAQTIRSLSFRNLDLAFLTALALKISHVLCQGRPLHPLSVRVWNDAVSRHGSR